MNNTAKKITSLIVGAQAFLTLLAGKALAITNPVLNGDLGTDIDGAKSGSLFVRYFVVIWNAFITIGALMVIVFFLWGGIEWISAGGDASKVEKARNRITQAVIGIIILVSSFVLIELVSTLFFDGQFSILNFTFTAPGE